MLLFILIFATVTALYRRRGWISPLIGIAAVLTYFAVEVLTWAVIGYVNPASAFQVDKYSYFVHLGASLYAALCTIFLYFLLSLMLPTIDYRAATKVSRVPYRLIGYAILLGTLLLTVYLIYLAVNSGDREYSRSVSGIVVLALFTAWPCFKLGKLQSRAASRWKLLESQLPPILYLRSFELESEKRQNMRTGNFFGSGSSSFDELLELATKDIGVQVALGDSEDYLPTAGALKVYPGDDRWQEYVTRLSELSIAVFFVEGHSSGLSWELQFIRENIDPGKVFLFTSQRNFRKAFHKKHGSSLWNSFCQQLEQAGFPELGKDPGTGAVIKFDHNWRPKLLASGLKQAKSYKAVLKKNVPANESTFDYSQISDLIFTGLVETDVQENSIGLKRGFQMTLVSLATVTLSTFVAAGVWQYLDNRSMLPLKDDELTTEAGDQEGSKQIVYRGSTIPYSIDLTGSWRSLPPDGEFDLLFEGRSGEAAIGVIAEDPGVAPPGFDNRDYLSIVLNNANNLSSTPLEVLQRDTDMIGGKQWGRVVYGATINGMKVAYISVVHVGPVGIFQILGWSIDPEKHNSTLERAMRGFQFPDIPGTETNSPDS
jgi:hypothetical protein